MRELMWKAKKPIRQDKSWQQGRSPAPSSQLPPRFYPGRPVPPAQLSESSERTALRRLGIAGAGAIMLVPFLILLAVFLLIAFVGRPYIVHGESMMPTLHDCDRVFIVPYRGNTTPSREDVVVLKDIEGSPDLLIKRVVALAGDRVRVENDRIVVNDRYVHKSTNRYVPKAYTTLVPDDHIFVMGDNEQNSFDSRTFGSVPQSKVTGKALVIFWPPTDCRKL